MATDTFIVFAASYETLSAAEADYQAVRELYLTYGLVDTYDAAVITKGDGGKVHIVAKHEQPTRQGAWHGLGIGLAGGALVALFPAVSFGGGLLLGGAGGAGLGAMAGHVIAGLRRADLKDLGELLDDGRSGLVIVAVSDLGDRVEQVIRHARGLTGKQLKADEALVARDIDEAASGSAAYIGPSYQQGVAEAEAAVREAEAEAAAAERAAEKYSTFGSGDDLVNGLDDLARLRGSGVLSAAEFETAKARLLGE